MAEELHVDGPVGRLEALLDEPDEPARGAAVVCHPHPLHGGTMQNTVVFRLARALWAAGFVTLRFNFRGVEGSAGQHDGEGGEEGDVAACLDLLAERYPGLPLWAAGYSFGARTVCELAPKDGRIERVVLVAPPVAVYDCRCLEDLRQPGLLVFGSGDEFGTLTELAQKHPALPEHLELHEITGADHFFRGRTPLLEESVRDHATRALEPR